MIKFLDNYLFTCLTLLVSVVGAVIGMVAGQGGIALSSLVIGAFFMMIIYPMESLWNRRRPLMENEGSEPTESI